MAINYLIVVSILEGRNFPVRHDKLLVVEAKFDGEVMSTDPVAHIMHPDFNTELAWEVDKKGLQMHRLQRTPIKLLWYAVDLELARKETIGYVILDIRLAQEKLQNSKWAPLLNAKYQKEKPEVLVSLFLERSTEQIQAPLPNGNVSVHHRRSSTSSERNGPKKQSSTSLQKSPLPVPQNGLPRTYLKPVLLSHAGCYQIGPPEHCTEKYMVSVTLAFAANLNKLTPPAMLKSSKGFYFYYSLFENDVTTETFSSLSNPEFPAERASVKISSSSKLLSEYFEQNRLLEIILCCDDVSLGSGQIPIGPLSCVSNRDIDQQPLCIEGSVQIIPTEKTSRSGGDDLSPFVGVTVVLQKDKSEGNSGEKSQTTPIHDVSISEGNGSLHILRDVPVQLNHSFVQKTACSKNEEVQTNDGTLSSKNDSPNQVENNVHIPSNQTVPKCNHSADNTPISNAKNISSRPASIPMTTDSSARRFYFTLDLFNFQATRLAHPINLFIRYSYPFFGTTSSVITHPDVEVHPKCEVSIPHGYCGFDFSATFANLKSTFWEAPLILEVLNRKNGGQEQLVGTGRINLFQVLGATPINHIIDKKHSTRQMVSCKVVVTSPEGYEIGEISATITLDDLGHTSKCEHHSSKSDVSLFPQARNIIPNFEIPLLRQNGLTQDELIQAALELELWQERQREIFRAQLKDKEIQHLSILTSEWKQRDREREILLQKKLQECQKLEDKLKQTLQDADLKEKQLSAQEAELSLRLRNMDRQQEQQQKETKNHIEAIKMEYNELLTLERLNVRDLEQKNNALIRQIKELEKDLQEQKNIIENLKAQINKQPDVKLMTEVNILNMEKAELLQKLEAALASKQKYKVQWGQSVRQQSLLQQRLHMMERLEMVKKDEELAVLQQRLLASEKRAIHTNDESQFRDKAENGKSIISPESMKFVDAQVTVVNNASNIPTTDSSIKPWQNSNAFQKTSSNVQFNTVAKQVVETSRESVITSPITNSSSNTKPNVNSSNNSKPNLNASNMIKPNGDASDLNGNTKPKECTLEMQHLMAQKEKLITSGIYSENDQIIKELNAHIDKARLASK